MTGADAAGYALRALGGHRMRSALMLIAMALGVAAVVVLTALGEGARRYVQAEFSALGTHLLVVLPGRAETTGAAPPLFGVTPRDLTVEDAMALERSRAVALAAPISVGVAAVSRGSHEREALALGTTASFQQVRHLSMARGRFLPEGDPRRGQPVAVIGRTTRQALFGNANPVGGFIRVGDRRFRVIGELSSAGRSLGIDLDELVVIPVNQAQALFNRPGLFRVILQANPNASMNAAREQVLEIIKKRHEGEDDVTVITQDGVAATFNKIFQALTFTVAGIAAISLLVAGILVMNVMLVAVSQRTAEVGLLKAIGARPGQVLSLFLAEAAILALCGGLLGLAAGYAAVAAIGAAYPAFPLAAPLWAALSALLVSVVTGLLFGAWPARRAARLDPVIALSGRG
ncbi:MAG: ABC transporter permease [Leptospirillia bacterium]